MQDIDKFLEAVEENNFIDGHEVLEQRWKELKKDPKTIDESKILKGLINGSTALALKILGKEKGALAVWNTFEKYRVLINTKPCKNTLKYKQAEKLLDEKHKLYM